MGVGVVFLYNLHHCVYSSKSNRGYWALVSVNHPPPFSPTQSKISSIAAERSTINGVYAGSTSAYICKRGVTSGGIVGGENAVGLHPMA